MVSSPTQAVKLLVIRLKWKNTDKHRKTDLHKKYHHQNIHLDKYTYMNQECCYISLSRGTCWAQVLDIHLRLCQTRTKCLNKESKFNNYNDNFKNQKSLLQDKRQKRLSYF